MTTTTLTMNTATTTTTESVTSSLMHRSPASVKSLPLIDPKAARLQTPPDNGTRQKLRKLPSKNSSFSAIKGANDSAPTLPDRAPEAIAAAEAAAAAVPPSPLRMRRARSGAYRAAESGSRDILPVASTPRPPLRSRRSGNSMVSRSLSGDHHLMEHTQPRAQPITPNQLRSSVKSLRSRRRSSSRLESNTGTTTTSSSASVGCLNDSASYLSDDGSAPLYELDELEQRLYSNNDHQDNQHFRKNSSGSFHKPAMYADDVIDNDDEQSQGVNKKSRSPPTMFFSKLKSSAVDSATWLNMKPPQFITLMLLLAITCFVAGSYRQVLAATDRIESVRTSESKILVHLHKVEQQALELAEILHRINDRSEGGGNAGGVAADGGGPQGGSQENAPSSAAQVDSDLIRAQVEKLRDMEAELDHEVGSLRKKIQQSAQQALVAEYGQGAIQVLLQVETLNENGALVVESDPRKNILPLRLWYDTPHTSHIFLQQIKRGAWNGATFSIQAGRALVADPILDKSSNGEEPPRLEPGLDFLEPSERGHERYTVTLTDSNLSINLQDNKRIHKQEACVGIIFEGYDVLHTVVQNANNQAKTVRIKAATASHMTRAETSGLI